MAYASPSTQPTGTFITSTHWAQLVNNDKFFHGVPTVRVRRPASQSIPNAAWTAISWSSKDWDTNGMFATTGTKVTCKTAGKYLVNISVGFTATTAGSFRMIGIRKNSTGTGAPTDGSAGIAIKPAAGNAPDERPGYSNIIAMTTGQFVQMVCFQDSGVGLTVGITEQAFMSLLWVSS